MIFNTVAYYLLFLIPAVIAYRIVSKPARPWVLTVFGVLFFLYFSYTEMGGTPAAACVLIFAWETALSRFYRPGSKLCLVGIGQSILILLIFKYWNFFTGIIWPDPNLNPLYWKGMFLPLGVSFFTFEFIHYAVDRYYNRVEAGTVGEYTSFIFFYPTMIAGPIKRYQYFRPSLENELVDWGTDLNRGTTRILSGLVKKFMIADMMTALTIHLNVADIAFASRPVLCLWLLAYGIKIYFDFSGYSDIAIGSARLFGMKVPENFDWPYLQTSISEFWQHWHISLYRWLLDYVFIPLGGSRVKPVRIYTNIMLTMLVSGLWHGAAMNFVVWGTWHGMLLCVHRRWAQFRQRIASPVSLAEKIVAWTLTFVCVQIGWAFFAMNVPTFSAFFHRLILGR